MLEKLPFYMAECLILTILIEGAVALILGYRKTDLLFTMLVNIMTNPVVVVSTFLVGFFFGNKVRTPVEITEEILVVIIEGFVYYKVMDRKKINPFLLSLILNGASYGMGFVINALR